MNRKLVLVVALGLMGTQIWAQEKAPKKIELKTDLDKTAYGFGASAAMGIRHQFETMGLPLDGETVLRGFRDAISNGKLALTDEEMNAASMAVAEEVSKRNAEQGDAFLAANKKKKEITTLPSGLQYKVLKKGTGKTPTIKDVVTVNFRGRLINGKEFNNTYALKQPYTTPIVDTIAGWVEALPLMQVGSKWELYVPPDLAYGAVGNEAIPPNATLVYEVELMEIVKPGAGSAARGKPQAPEEIK